MTPEFPVFNWVVGLDGNGKIFGGGFEKSAIERDSGSVLIGDVGSPKVIEVAPEVSLGIPGDGLKWLFCNSLTI